MSGRRAIRRGFSAISLLTLALMPFSSIPSFSALIAITVMAHAASPEATRSVGEKLSPRPLLSFGASVSRTERDGPWVR